MKAIQMTEAGTGDVLALNRVDTPVVTEDDQVLVRLHAAGINPVDIKMREGAYSISPLPFTLGWDGAGVVEAVGAAVSHVSPGDEVWVFYGSFGDRQGTYAEYVLATERNVSHKPASLSFIQAASAPLALLTAWESLYDRAQLQSGQSVLIHAGAGGVGQFAIQLARHRGATVYTTVGSAEKARFVKRLGADAAILYKDSDFAEAVMDLTAGHGVDVVLDMVGGDTVARSAPVTRHYGNIVTLLKISADADLSPARLRNQRIGYELVLSPLLFRLQEHQLRQRDILERAADMFEQGQLRTEISATFALDQAQEAHAMVETGSTMGKVVLEIR